MECCQKILEWNYYKIFYKILGLISLGLCIILFILTFCKVDEGSNENLLTIYLYSYVSLVSRSFVSFKNILNPNFKSCWDLFNNIIVIIFNILLISSCLSLLSEFEVEERGVLYAFMIISLINLPIDVMFIIPPCRRNPGILNDGNTTDVYEEYLWERECINNNIIQNEINELDIINYFIKTQNNKLINSGNVKGKITQKNISDKKIDAILLYFKDHYNKSFSPNDLFQYFLDKIKENYGLDIDQNKFREMSLIYIQKKLTEYLICPLSKNIFIDPVTTMEGQTFERDEILKEINLKGKNPLDGKNLNSNELIENKLVAKISKMLRTNKGFKLETFVEIRKLLINPNNKDYFSNPYVICEGSKIGETAEDENDTMNYKNKVIANIIEQNGELLSNDFLEDIK